MNYLYLKIDHLRKYLIVYLKVSQNLCIYQHNNQKIDLSQK